MAGLILDSMGTIKMQVLENAMLTLQRLNALNENYALEAKKGKASPTTVQNIKRQLVTLAANLKNQFGMISDQATNLYVQSSRGSSDQARVRTIREGIAALKQAIEIGQTQTIAKHEVDRHAKKPGAAEAE
jgi:hypothetical protein